MFFFYTIIYYSMKPFLNSAYMCSSRCQYTYRCIVYISEYLYMIYTHYTKHVPMYTFCSRKTCVQPVHMTLAHHLFIFIFWNIFVAICLNKYFKIHIIHAVQPGDCMERGGFGQVMRVETIHVNAAGRTDLTHLADTPMANNDQQLGV